MSFPNENSDNNTCIMQADDSNQEVSANEGENQSAEPEMTQPDTNDAVILVEGQSTPACTEPLPVTNPKKRKRTKNNSPQSESGKKNSFTKQFELSQGNPAPCLPKSDLRMEDFRLSQDTYQEIEVVEVASAYEIRKPRKEEFVRTHPDQSSHLPVGVIKEKTGMNERLWLVTEKIMKACPDEVTIINLRVTVNRSGQVFLWPLNIGSSNLWNQSALQAAEQAKTHWVRLISKKEEGRYQIMVAKGELPDPVWSEFDIWEMIQLGFGDRMITDLNHPYLQQLRGEI